MTDAPPSNSADPSPRASNGVEPPSEIQRAQAFLELYHSASKGLKGVFVLTSIDAPALDGGGKETRESKARTQQFRIGDVDAMLQEAWQRSLRSNNYFGPTLLKNSLPRGQRGKVEDIVAVLGLVIDDDGDAGKQALRPPGIEPTVEICTSRQPAINLQPHYIFNRPLPPKEAMQLAELLYIKCGGDSGTKDIAHVWRIPLTWNHPSGIKVRERGRPLEPQRVEIVGGSFQLVDPDQLRLALESMPDRVQQRKTNGAANGSYTGGSTDRDEILVGLPKWVIRLVQTEVGKAGGDRSSHCFNTLMALMECELTDDEILLVAEGAPFALKYVERGDIDKEIARARVKWTGVIKSSKKERARRSEEENPPEPDVIKNWPFMESAAMSGIVGEIVRLVTANSEADPVAVAVTVLTYAAAEFGRVSFTRIGDEAHHSRHFNAIVGQSSRARKGTSEKPVNRIFKRAEELRIRAAPSLFPSNNSLRITPGPLSSGEGLVWAIRDDVMGADGQVEAAGVRDKRLLVVEQELGAALRSFQRQGNNLSTTLRVAWDGGKIEPLTKHSQTTATGPHVCILGHVTIPELKALLSGTDIWNGFANRFQWMLARRSKLVPNPTAMPQEQVDALAARLARAVRLAHDAGNLPGRELVFTDAAQTLWTAVYPELSREVTGVLGAVTSRMEAHCRRLALTYALLDEATAINEEHLEAGLAICRYAYDSAEYLFGDDVSSDPVVTRILAALAERPRTQSEVVSLFGNRPPQNLNEILKLLQERGAITGTRASTGGRPKVTWTLVDR